MYVISVKNGNVQDNMKKQLRLWISVSALGVCTFAGGCSVCDWCHDLCYGNNPVAATPIAPPAAPMPGEYSEEEAAALMTDSLIFALSNLSANGKPAVRLVPQQTPQSLAEKVYRDLLRNRAIRCTDTAQAPGKGDYLLFSGLNKNGSWCMTLENPDRSATLFNQTIKLKNNNGKADEK